MERSELLRLLGQANDGVDRVDSDSPSSNTVSDPDVGAHPDSDSDSDSAASEISTEELDSFPGGRLVRVRETDERDQFVKNRFLAEMSRSGMQTTVESVYKNSCSGIIWQAKLRSHLEIARNMLAISKVKYAWFAGSKEEITNIFRFGFASRGRGICLSPVNSPNVCARGCVADENGLCHMILCSAILGRSELVPADSQQHFPSSEEFHSGVDNLANPHVYLVWTSFMNTHVFPKYVVSFRPPIKANGASASVRPAAQANPARANEGVANAAASGEHMIPVGNLILELATGPPFYVKKTLYEFYGDFRAKKITKQELLQKLRQLVGDDVLYRTIMSVRRRRGEPEEAAPGGSSSAVAAQRRSGANRVLKNLRGAKRSA